MEKATNTGNILRVAIVGPESTGKSTLAEELAKRYNTLFVPEYAREYVDKLNRPYTINDIVNISKKQVELEDAAAAKANKILVCDTTLMVTKIWAEHKYGKCPAWITKHYTKRQYVLYLLCNTDVPWQPDPQREHPHSREHLFELYRLEVEKQKSPFAIISGLNEVRTATAVKAIENLVKQDKTA